MLLNNSRSSEFCYIILIALSSQQAIIVTIYLSTDWTQRNKMGHHFQLIHQNVTVEYSTLQILTTQFTNACIMEDIVLSNCMLMKNDLTQRHMLWHHPWCWLRKVTLVFFIWFGDEIPNCLPNVAQYVSSEIPFLYNHYQVCFVRQCTYDDSQDVMSNILLVETRISWDYHVNTMTTEVLDYCVARTSSMDGSMWRSCPIHKACRMASWDPPSSMILVMYDR